MTYHQVVKTHTSKETDRRPRRTVLKHHAMKSRRLLSKNGETNRIPRHSSPHLGWFRHAPPINKRCHHQNSFECPSRYALPTLKEKSSPYVGFLRHSPPSNILFNTKENVASKSKKDKKDKVSEYLENAAVCTSVSGRLLGGNPTGYSSAFYDYIDHAFENAKRNKKKSSSDVSKESNDSIELLKSLGILPTTFDDTTLCEIRDHQFVDNFKTIIENLVLPFFASSMKRILFGEGHRLGFNHSLGICEVKHWDDVFDDSTCTNNSTNRSCSIHTEQNGNSPLFTSISSSAKAYHVEQMRQEMSESLKRKIEYGEVPKSIVEAQNRALANRVGIWSLHEEKKEEVSQPLVKSKAETVTVRLSEIRSGGHFFFQVVGDDTASIIDKSMKEFTAHNGTDGAPCDLKVGKVVAAALDDGSGKSWYRAKITERKARHVKVLFVDHRNISTVPIATHLRPLDPQLGVVRIPPVAKEATLALTKTRSLDDDEGIEAARLL